MATNAIIPLMPKRARLTLYAIYGGLGVVVGAVQVGYAAAEAGQPTWLTVTLAVYAFLGGAFGYTATTQAGDQVELRAGPLPSLSDSEPAQEIAEMRSEEAARRRNTMDGAGTPRQDSTISPEG